MNYELAKESRQRKYIALTQLKERNLDYLMSSAGYHSTHQWLKRNFGSPKICEHCGVTGYKEKGGRWSIHFALKQGFQHSHDRINYIALCRHCHGIYDWNDQKTENMKAAASRQKGTKSRTKSLIAKSRKRNHGQFIAS